MRSAFICLAALSFSFAACGGSIDGESGAKGGALAAGQSDPPPASTGTGGSSSPPSPPPSTPPSTPPSNPPPSNPPAPKCFDAFTPADAPALKLGTGNAVFPATQIIAPTVSNYSGQTVFPTPSWEIRANFPESTEADNTSIDLPAQLSQVAANVGVLHVGRPQCTNETVGGRTVKVQALWRLNGAIGGWPTHGIALGATNGTSLADTTTSFVKGDDEGTRALNTLNELVLQHTFDAQDTTLAADLVLQLWLLDSFEFPSTLYVNRVDWL